MRKFIRRSEASDIVEFAYNEYANLEQRTALVQEFYGSEFAVFKSDITSPSSQPVTQDVLGHVLGQHPDKSAHILARMRDSLLPLVDKYVNRPHPPGFSVCMYVCVYVCVCVCQGGDASQYCSSSSPRLHEALFGGGSLSKCFCCNDWSLVIVGVSLWLLGVDRVCA